jgi:hypothetical protein
LFIAVAILYGVLDRHVTNELMAKLRKYFDEDAVVELTGLIAFQNLSSKFISASMFPRKGSVKFHHLPVE